MTTPIPNCPQPETPIRDRAWADGQIHGERSLTVSPAMVDKAYRAYAESTGHCMRERVQDALVAATEGAMVLSHEGQALIARMVGAHAAVVHYIAVGRYDLALAESKQWVEWIHAANGATP